MKKIYLAVLPFIAGITMHAQLTQANHAPVSGYTFQTFQCDSTAISPGASGINALWTFSAITTHSSVLLTYQTSTVNSPSYPSATIAVASSPANTSYFNSSATSLSFYGGNIAVGTIKASLIYATPAVVAAYPMSMGTTSSSVVGGTINATQPITTSGTFTGTSNVLVDGSGTITLPGTNMTFTNVLRVVTSQTIDFTTPFVSGSVIQKNYDYYSIGTRASLFTISTTTGIVAGSPTTQTMVTRSKIAPTASNVAVMDNGQYEVSLSVFPNPSTAVVNFVTENKDAKTISIYDITGKLLEKTNFTDGKIKIDVSDYNKGLYIYTLSNSDNRTLKTGKITVIQ